MIFHDAMAPFDAKERHIFKQRITQLLPDSTQVWIDRDFDQTFSFDHVYHLTEDGEVIDLKGTDNYKTVERDSDMDILSIIGQSALFGKLKPEQQQLLAENSRVVTTAAGEFIYKQGDISNNVFLILSGKANSYRDINDLDSVAGRLGRGECLGVLEVIAQRSRILSVKAETDLVLLRVDGTTIRELYEADPSVTHTLLRGLIDW